VIAVMRRCIQASYRRVRRCKARRARLCTGESPPICFPFPLFRCESHFAEWDPHWRMVFQNRLAIGRICVCPNVRTQESPV
jgi:hypothetical protein